MRAARLDPLAIGMSFEKSRIVIPPLPEVLGPYQRMNSHCGHGQVQDDERKGYEHDSRSRASLPADPSPGLIPFSHILRAADESRTPAWQTRRKVSVSRRKRKRNSRREGRRTEVPEQQQCQDLERDEVRDALAEDRREVEGEDVWSD
jgi:hypothetical protein